jgi:hypothetical protein
VVSEGKDLLLHNRVYAAVLPVTHVNRGDDDCAKKLRGLRKIVQFVRRSHPTHNSNRLMVAMSRQAIEGRRFRFWLRQKGILRQQVCLFASQAVSAARLA